LRPLANPLPGQAIPAARAGRGITRLLFFRSRSFATRMPPSCRRHATKGHRRLIPWREFLN